MLSFIPAIVQFRCALHPAQAASAQASGNGKRQQSGTRAFHLPLLPALACTTYTHTTTPATHHNSTHAHKHIHSQHAEILVGALPHLSAQHQPGPAQDFHTRMMLSKATTRHKLVMITWGVQEGTHLNGSRGQRIHARRAGSAAGCAFHRKIPCWAQLTACHVD